MNRDLSQLDLLLILTDGIETDKHTIVIAVGIEAQGIEAPRQHSWQNWVALMLSSPPKRFIGA